MSSARALGIFLPVALLASCGFPSIPPRWVTDREALPACGVEDVGHGEGRDEAARRCLLEAFVEGRDAELITTATSIEGDPITRYVRVHADGAVELYVDSTRDGFGSGTWQLFRCERLVPVAEYNDPPDTFVPAEEVFVEMGCEEAGTN